MQKLGLVLAGAAASVQAQTRLRDPISNAKHLNEHRDTCNASMTLNDGISERRNEMTTML
jgi:hypothetical protein